MASNPQVHDILTELSDLDDELLKRAENADKDKVTAFRAYRNTAEMIREVIEKHRTEPEFEWGVKYVYAFNGKEYPGEEWGFEFDPRLPFIDDKGNERRAEIQDGMIWIDRNDRGRVVAVSKRVKATPEVWEDYEHGK